MDNFVRLIYSEKVTFLLPNDTNARTVNAATKKKLNTICHMQRCNCYSREVWDFRNRKSEKQLKIFSWNSFAQLIENHIGGHKKNLNATTRLSKKERHSLTQSMSVKVFSFSLSFAVVVVAVDGICYICFNHQR